MKKIIFSVLAVVCVLFMSSCGDGNKAYTSEDLFGVPVSEVDEGDPSIGSLLPVVFAPEGARLGNVDGPLLDGKTYVNTPGRVPEEGDWAMIYRSPEDNFYIYYSENDGTGMARRTRQAKQWCEANLK